MKKLVMAVALLAATSSFASVMLNAGLRNTSPTTNSGSLTGKMDYQFGVLYKYDFGSDWALRTGASYTPRSWTSANATGTPTYLDIPVTARYNFNAEWSAFGGLLIAYKIGFASTGGVTDTGYKSMTTPLALGGTYTIAAVHGITAEYEMSTEYANISGTTLNYSNLNLTYQYAF